MQVTYKHTLSYALGSAAASLDWQIVQHIYALAAATAGHQALYMRLTRASAAKQVKVAFTTCTVVQGTVHRSWVQAQSLLTPIFDGVVAEQKHLTLLRQVPHHMLACLTCMEIPEPFMPLFTCDSA